MRVEYSLQSESCTLRNVALMSTKKRGKTASFLTSTSVNLKTVPDFVSDCSLVGKVIHLKNTFRFTGQTLSMEQNSGYPGSALISRR